VSGISFAPYLVRFDFFCPEVAMSDTSVTKVQSKHSPRGAMGQKHLAAGIHVGMRLWEKEPPDEAKPASVRDYETVGYVLEGRAELHLEGQMVLLEPGDCWVVPKGAKHTYKVLETFTAVEATCPPALVHGRDRT
jgi:quercetin dioxygenase-like cupin family protein